MNCWDEADSTLTPHFILSCCQAAFRGNEASLNGLKNQHRAPHPAGGGDLVGRSADAVLSLSFLKSFPLPSTLPLCVVWDWEQQF